jgi:pseudaminic acid synthase
MGTEPLRVPSRSKKLKEISLMSNPSQPMFVAEISANHLGNFERAKSLVLAAIDSGATAVKFQTYTAETMTLDLDTPEFRISEGHLLWGGQKLYDLYESAHTPWEWHETLFQICRDRNVIPFSSPFDSTAVEFLETLNAPMYKIASMETGDLPLIRKVAETGKPLIISTGATELEEIASVVDVVHKSGNQDLTLLVCTSSYPSEPIDAHLNRIAVLRQKFGVKVGVSDHTLGIGVSIAAIALGATIVEKHFTLRRADGGADGAFSMEPEEFSLLVEEGNNAFFSLGNSEWRMQESEKESRRLRRSLYVARDVAAGEVISHQNVRAIRPGSGCAVKHLDDLIGKKFVKAQSIGTPMQLGFAE